MVTESWCPHPQMCPSDLLFQVAQDVGIDKTIDSLRDKLVVDAPLIVKKSHKHNTAL